MYFLLIINGVLGLIALMAVVSSGMESIFHFKFLINGVGIVSLVFYYLYLHTQTFKRDALTQTLTRHSFYTDAEYYQKGQLYRMGGDEFMILCPKTTESNAKKMMSHIQKDISRRGYSIAWGMAAYEPEMNFDQVCSKIKRNVRKRSDEILSGSFGGDHTIYISECLSSAFPTYGQIFCTVYLSDSEPEL